MNQERPYRRFSTDPRLSYTYQRFRLDNTNRHPHLRFWIWIICSLFFIIFFGWATNFLDKCKEGLIYESLSFKLCVIFFLFSFILSVYVVLKIREYRYNRVEMVRIHLYTSGVSSLVFGILSLLLFTVSIYPVFREASMAFSILAALFFVNLGCLILYD